MSFSNSKLGRKIMSVTINIAASASTQSHRAGIGIVIKDYSGRILSQHSHAIRASLNEAYYTAVIIGMNRARKHGAYRIKVLTDSQLVVRQINGDYAVSDSALRRLCGIVLQWLRWLTLSFEWIPKEANEEARQLARQAALAVTSSKLNR